METCTICNKEFKNLGVHLKGAHNMTKEDLEKETELTDERSEQAVQNTVVQNQVRVEKHLNTTKNEIDKKLKAVKDNLDFAYEQAEKLVGPANLEIQSSFVAEALVKYFGYKCSDVLSPNSKKGIQNKTWVLKKI